MATHDLHGDPLPAGAIARLGCVRLMHPGLVWDVAFSPDGRLIASCADDIRVSEVATGKPIARMVGHKGGVAAIAFAPDGRTVASVSEDATLRLWDVATGEQVRKIALGHEQGRAVAFASDDMIVVGAYMHVQVFTPKGKSVAKIDGDGWICDVVVDPGRQRVHVASEAGIWWFTLPRPGLLKTKAAGERHAVDTQSTNCLALSPDGRLLASAHYGKVVLRDADTGEPSRAMTIEGDVDSVAWSGDGQRLLTTGDSAHLWTVDGKPIRSFAKQKECDVEIGRFSRAGDVIATAGRGGDVRLWSADATRELVRWPRHTRRVADLGLSRDGARAVSSGSDAIWIWDSTTGRPLHQIEPGEDGGERVVCAPDGTFVAAARNDGKIAVYDTATGAPIKMLAAARDGRWFRSLAISPDGTRIAALEGDEALHCWLVAGGQLAWNKKIDVGSHVNRLVFSPDGAYLAACGNQRAGVWRASNGERVGLFGDQVWQLGFHDATTVVGACGDGFIRLWDVVSGEERRRMWYPGGEAVVSRDGSMIALSRDGVVHFHALPGLETLGELGPCHDIGIAFSGDGKRFATIEDSRNVLIWDIAHLATAPRGARPVYPGSERLASYQLVLRTLPHARFDDVRIGDGCTNACSPESQGYDFLGIVIHISDRGRVLAPDDEAHHMFDPPASPLVPMAGYFSRELDVEDADNVYVVAVNEQTGQRLRGRLVMDRPTHASIARPPVFDDDDDDGGDGDDGIPTLRPSQTGSWFTVNLSEQVPLPETAAAYRVHLEHAVVDTLKSEAVRVEIDGAPAKPKPTKPKPTKHRSG
jgi:WD40 repeat protein